MVARVFVIGVWLLGGCQEVHKYISFACFYKLTVISSVTDAAD